MDKIPYLKLQDRKGSRYLYLFGSNSWKLGRDKNSDFIIPDRWISRIHAALIQFNSGKDFYLIDWQSRNGTFINGSKITSPTVLKNGDRIILGKTILEFHCPQTKDKIGKYECNVLTSTVHVKRLMSVVAIEIRDFNILVRMLDESVLSSLIGTFFREIEEIIANYRGREQKSLAGIVLAFWYHQQQESIAAQLVDILNCIGTIAKMTAEINQQYSLPFELQISVAVNTGYAMVSHLGRSNYTAVGNTVNLALALGSEAKDRNWDLALSEDSCQYLVSRENILENFISDRLTLEDYESSREIQITKFEDLKQFLSDNISKIEI